MTLSTSNKINFVMTGSIAGGRGLEALLLLQQLPTSTPNFGRCIVVVWENEAEGALFEQIKALPHKVVIVPAPPRRSFGFMENQYKSLLAAMPFFSDDELIVRVRTDFNLVLPPLLTFLDKIAADGRSIANVLRGRIACGEISVLHPGRIQEFNFAGTKKALQLIGWCESYFTTDYIKVDMEPEFRWFGLQFVQNDPLFFYLYDKRDMRHLMRSFFDRHYVGGGAIPERLPAITKYIAWRIAHIALERFVCCLNLGGRNVSQDVLFNWRRPDISVFHDNIPDLRITSHSALADIAGLAPEAPNWVDFVAEATAVADKEAAQPGHTIELFEQEFGPPVETHATSGVDLISKANAPTHPDTSMKNLLDSLEAGRPRLAESFRDFPSPVLMTLRKSGSESLLIITDHLKSSDTLESQLVNRYAGFSITVFCGLVDQGQIRSACSLLEHLVSSNRADLLSELTRVVANRSTRFERTGEPDDLSPAELPNDPLNYDMLRDYFCCLREVANSGFPDDANLIRDALTTAKSAIASQLQPSV